MFAPRVSTTTTSNFPVAGSSVGGCASSLGEAAIVAANASATGAGGSSGAGASSSSTTTGFTGGFFFTAVATIGVSGSGTAMYAPRNTSAIARTATTPKKELRVFDDTARDVIRENLERN